MLESSSSDQQIFKKRRKTHTKPEEALEDLFDDESIESLSEEHYVNQETYTIINEVFGNGDEYNYIYNKTAKDSISEAQTEISINEDNSYDNTNMYYYENDDILYYLTRRTNLTEKEKDDIKKLISGDSVFLLAYHTDTTFTVQELFECKDRLAEFKTITKLIDCYMSAKSTVDESTNIFINNFYIKSHKFLENANEAEDLRQYFDYLKQNISNYISFIESKILIIPDLLYENYINKQTMHEPKLTHNHPCLENDIYIFYSKNPIFIKVIVNLYYEFGMVQENNGNVKYIKEFTKDELEKINVNDKFVIFIDDNVFDENLFKYFRGNDSFDEQRFLFLKKCISNVHNFENKLKNKCILEIKKNAKKEVTEMVIDRIVNGSIELMENEYGCGLYEINGMFYASIINYKGNCINFYNEKNINKIMNNILENRVKYIAYLCKEKGMRYTLKSINTILNENNNNDQLCDNNEQTCTNVVCIESLIVDSLYDKTNHKSYTTGIARRVLFPEIEFCKMYNNNISIKNEMLNKEEVMDCIKKGIQVSFSIIGIDVNLLKFSEFKDCLAILDFSTDFNEIVNEFGTVDSLQNLENTILSSNTNSNNAYIIGNRINDYNNACTYLRIKNNTSKQNTNAVLLDSFMVHPKNYRLANFVCSAALKIETVNENTNELIENLCKESDKLKNLCVKSLNFENYKLLNKIRIFMILYTRNMFQGISDKTIFEEIVGLIDTKILYEGRIKRVGEKYVIVEIHNKKTEVFVQKTIEDNYFVNQIVSVQLLEPDYFNLSYTGTIVNTEKKRKLRFLEHPLFKFFDYFATEKFLYESNKILVLRKSSKSDDAVITLKIDTAKRDNSKIKNNNRFCLVHYKLIEQENGYVYENTTYDKIDEFISVYIRSIVQNVKRIKKHMRFCESEEEARFAIVKMNYCFYLSLVYPGKVVFAYKKDNDMKKEYINIGMKLKYNEKEFDNLDEFITYKKKRAQ
ncbi:Transcription elongation factor spt6 [Binucleata daphniae]